MIRKLLMPALLAGLLGGCATTYTYHQDGGDYYYGEPGVDYRYHDYGYGYGSYFGGWYGWGPRYPYYGYYGVPYRYYGYPYYDPYPYWYGHRRPHHPRPHDGGNPPDTDPGTDPTDLTEPRGSDIRRPPSWRDLDGRSAGRPRVASPQPGVQVEGPGLRERQDIQLPPPRPEVSSPRPEPRVQAPRAPEPRVAPSLPPMPRSEPRRTRSIGRGGEQ